MTIDQLNKLTDEEVRYGRLVAIKIVGRRKSGKPTWEFRCDCGATVVRAMTDVRQGRIRSCGCYRKDCNRANKTKHGCAPRKNHTKEYVIWAGMKARCKDPNFPRYGAAGIKVCERWENSFLAFMEDMGKCPPGHSIDRKNTLGNYEPSNCRWATAVEQSRNRTSCIFVTIGGATKTVSEWADLHGLKRNIAYDRIKYGWDPIKAVTTPKTR